MPGLKGLGNGSGPQFSAWLFPMEYASPATSVSSSTWLTGKTVGRFTIHERLGKGGMGEVYRAEDTRLKRTVALKRLTPLLRSDPLYRRRFQLEAERASRFADPHVAAIYDVIDEQDETLLVMEYVEGQTLRQRLLQSISLEDFLRIAIECAEALVAADRVGIVHCDIKPENIMLSSSGSVKILDFGVAKFLPRSDQSSTVDRSGTIGGTPAYMAPEVLLEKSADGRSDIFSLGLVLYEALAGHHPFLSDSYVATTHRILHEKAAPIRVFNRRVPEELDRIVAQAMAKEPSDRYPSAHDLLDDLRAVQAGVTPSKLLPVPVLQQAKRFWSPIFAILVLLLIGASYGIYRWTHPHPTFRERGWALIADFESSGEEAIHDKSVREGLTIALQQSPYVNVYPRPRVYEALQRMKRAEMARIDENLGREICRRENVQLLLTGSIEHIGDVFQMSVRGVDPESGNLLFAEKQRFQRKEEFFGKTDDLARAVRRDLGESMAKIEKTSRPLAKVTTRSLEALQLYSEASDYMARGKLDPVPNLLQGALQLDADFAMAHLQLGRYYSWLVGKNQKASAEFRRAYELREGVTDREQRRIEAAYFQNQERYEDAVRSLTILVNLYPDDAEAHASLASAYSDAGEFPKALDELRRAVVLNPFSAPAYRLLILYLARAERANEAIAVFREAEQRGLDDAEIHWTGGLAYLSQGNVAAARDEFRRISTDSETNRALRELYLVVADLYEGKLSSARAALSSQVGDGVSTPVGLQLVRRAMLGRLLLLLGDRHQALVQADLIRQSPESALMTTNLADAAILYARAGRVAEAGALLLRLDTIRKLVPSSWNQTCYHTAAGEIWLARNNLAEAESSFREAAEAYPYSYPHIGLARTYEAEKNWSSAIAEWQKVLSWRGEILHNGFPPDLALAHVQLARSYRQVKNWNGARDEYNELLHMSAQGENVPWLHEVRHEAAQFRPPVEP